MTETVQNEPTKTSPISAGYSKHVVSEFLDLYWPGLVKGDEYQIGVEDLEKLVRYAAWHFRANGSPDENQQVVRGWSKLTYRKDKFVPSEESIDDIKTNGATA